MKDEQNYLLHIRDLPMNRETKPNRLDVWGHSMLNKLPSISRKRRKRQASKKRRVLLRIHDSG